MNQPRIFAFLALLAISSGMTVAKVIQPDDKSGDDIRAAATQFLNDLADGKEKEVRAEFAGTGDAAKLLDRMINCLALYKQLTDAATAKFGAVNAHAPGIAGAIRHDAQAIPQEAITLSDDGLGASIPPRAQGDFIKGVELKKVNGQWKVSDPISVHGDDETRLVAGLDLMNEILPSIIQRIQNGEFANMDEMRHAVLQTGIPKMRAAATTRPALKKLLPPDTQPTTQPAP